MPQTSLPKASHDAAHILPDRLAPGLRMWFVGTAAGPASAARGAYYAHPGNRFWRALHQAGVTPRLFAPEEYPDLLALGVGLTDMCKTGWGVDAAIDRSRFDVDGFREKVERLKPLALAFTSKTAASLWLGTATGRIAIGRQMTSETTREKSDPLVFVLPSPSGLATSHWSIEPWLEAGAWLRDASAPAVARRPTHDRVAGVAASPDAVSGASES